MPFLLIPIIAFALIWGAIGYHDCKNGKAVDPHLKKWFNTENTNTNQGE